MLNTSRYYKPRAAAENRKLILLYVRDNEATSQGQISVAQFCYSFFFMSQSQMMLRVCYTTDRGHRFLSVTVSHCFVPKILLCACTQFSLLATQTRYHWVILYVSVFIFLFYSKLAFLTHYFDVIMPCVCHLLSADCTSVKARPAWLESVEKKKNNEPSNFRRLSQTLRQTLQSINI